MTTEQTKPEKLVPKAAPRQAPALPLPPPRPAAQAVPRAARLPSGVLARVYRLLSPITLDAAAEVPAVVQSRYQHLGDDGLKLPWWGRVYCLPPVSATEPWIEKALREYEQGRVDDLLLLLPMVATPGWPGLLSKAWRADWVAEPRSWAAFYLGKRATQFINTFGERCVVYPPTTRRLLTDVARY